MTLAEYEKKMQDIIDNSNNMTEKELSKIALLVEKARKEIAATVAQTDWQAHKISELKVSIEKIMLSFAEKYLSVMDDATAAAFLSGWDAVESMQQYAGIDIGSFAIPESMLSILQDYSADLITNMSEDVIGKITDTIALGILQGESVYEIMSKIGKNLDDPSVFSSIMSRAETIARTEIARANSTAKAARIKQLKSDFPELKIYKQWVHSGKSAKHSRKFHRNLDGIRIAENKKFKSKYDDIDYPHAPGIDAREAINCGCTWFLVFDEEQIAAMYKEKEGEREKELEREKERERELEIIPETRKKLPPPILPDIKERKNPKNDKEYKEYKEYLDDLEGEELIDARSEIIKRMGADLPEDIVKKIQEGTAHIPNEMLLDMERNGLTYKYEEGKGRPGFSNENGVITIYSEGMSEKDLQSAVAHETAHALDSLIGNGDKGYPGKIGGQWSDSKYVDDKDRENFNEWYDKNKTGDISEYDNGDGEYFTGNWLDDYEGRIYPGDGQGEEFFAMGSQRYADYIRYKNDDELLKNTFKDNFFIDLDSFDVKKETERLKKEIKEFESVKESNKDAGILIKTNEKRINFLKIIGKCQKDSDYAAKYLSEWDKQREYYPEFSNFLEEFYNQK